MRVRLHTRYVCVLLEIIKAKRGHDRSQEQNNVKSKESTMEKGPEGPDAR